MIEDEDTAAIVCIHIGHHNCPILFAEGDFSDEEDDSGWTFLCQNEAHVDEELEVWSLGEVIEFDNTIEAIVKGKPETARETQRCWQRAAATRKVPASQRVRLSRLKRNDPES